MRSVPNIISAFRICLVPVFILAYFGGARDSKIYAALVYAVATLSDFLDGFLARKFSASSNLGKVLDPLGDKLMTVAVMASITIDRLIPVWAVLIVVGKELLMALGGFVVHKMAGAEIPPSNIIGKTSTVVFFLVCMALMLFRDIPHNVATLLISAAIGLTFFAFFSYLGTFLAVMKNRNRD